MIRLAGVDDIVALYAARGNGRYGEGVTQVEHAVQCAALAEASGAAAALVAAALLHDIGHLLASDEDDAIGDGCHEAIGSAALSRLFEAGVREPIALHVAAKRYLCTIDADYFAGLSRASQASLEQQGGAFDAAAAATFARLRYASAAVALRRFDDHAKRTELAARPFAGFVPLLHDLVTGRHY